MIYRQLGNFFIASQNCWHKLVYSLRFEPFLRRPEIGGTMAGYRCYILDAGDHIVQAHDLDCESDAQAEATAENMWRGTPITGPRKCGMRQDGL